MHGTCKIPSMSSSDFLMGENIRPAYVLISLSTFVFAANTKSFSSLLSSKCFQRKKTEQRGTHTALVMQMQSPEVEVSFGK